MNIFDLQYFSQAAAAACEQEGEAVQAEEGAALQEQARESTPSAEENGQPSAEEAAEQPHPVYSANEKTDFLREELRIRGRERMRDWQAQEEKVRELYPSFSFYGEYNTNETFANLLRSGAGVREAYEVAHLPQILTAAMQYAAKKAAEKTAAGMRTGADRPLENGIGARRIQPPTEKGVDALTQADIIRILERVGKGDKVRF